jgi:hypothetical protein
VARRGRVKEEYSLGDATITLAYASRLDALAIDRTRPVAQAMAVFANEIRTRVKDRKRTALGRGLKTGHYRTGELWDSMFVSVLGGARGERVRAGFRGKRRNSDFFYNKDVAFTLSQKDGIAMLHPTEEETAALSASLSLDMADELRQTFGAGTVVTDAIPSDLADRLRGAFRG